MKKKYLFVLTFIISVLGFSGYAQNYDNGVFILNEGMFGTNTASVSFLNDSGTLDNDVFTTGNPGQDIGQLGQGMGFDGDNAYIIGSGSSEVNVVNSETFAHIATVTTGFNNPRYIAFDNGFGYITDWGDPGVTTDDYVAVMDLSTNTVVSTIAVVEGPERIVKKNNQLFIAHQGGYGFGTAVSIIDLTDNSVSQITVGDIPNSISVDDDYVYVLCGGKPAWSGDETLGQLYRIDLTDYSVMTISDFAATERPNYLQVDNGEAFYVLNNNIYNFDFTGSLPTTAFIDTSAQNVTLAYGLSLIDETLYLADAEDYVSNGKIRTYTTLGVYQNEYIVGLIPNGVYKNEMALGIYAPPADQTGSTAIAQDSPLFLEWATGATITRGLINISNPSATDGGSNYATFGTSDSALGMADGAVVSLGDGGQAILTFDTPIIDGTGFDFAVFENSFSDTFLELAFVEVSSDGVNYFRFPSHSQTQTDTQVGGFGSVDARYVNNLAGKYRSGFGTPFDISDIDDSALLDKNNITHIRVIDAVGSIDPAYATYDSYGNIVNELFSTPYTSSGFDLNAIGVINKNTLGVNSFSKEIKITLYPNPTTSQFYVSETGLVSVYSSEGRLVLKKNVESTNVPVNIENLTSGIYIVNITSDKGSATLKVVKK
ncbi:DUF5074 domain-containing protein [Psychroserpens sp. NJDZ02]|uniref:DUF5074 domain-containing protein n=1 Tax=Psychroserpens sp. NJDZ02 TaxID=2570561 RepID=UPI001F0DAE9E|nr:DUF5074 domain-containing protein [Psychroserpens sp. NJDZ02]